VPIICSDHGDWLLAALVTLLIPLSSLAGIWGIGGT
jgi:hypothetical protein